MRGSSLQNLLNSSAHAVGAKKGDHAMSAILTYFLPQYEYVLVLLHLLVHR